MKIDKRWTLFLDRDGVINYEQATYVLHPAQLKLYPNVCKAIATLNTFFSNIFIITNQRGVGKKMMTIDDLNAIHHKLLLLLQADRAEIKKIYYCTDLDPNSQDRKPNAGMAFRAKKEFPQIDLSKTVMVGNNLSDMQFGRNAGTKTVFIKTTHPDIVLPNPLIDLSFEGLPQFARHLEQQGLKNGFITQLATCSSI